MGSCAQIQLPAGNRVRAAGALMALARFIPAVRQILLIGSLRSYQAVLFVEKIAAENGGPQKNSKGRQPVSRVSISTSPLELVSTFNFCALL